jgi:peptidoglycan/xylan/chitin deacetylase (PgdA/CDA1 family)
VSATRAKQLLKNGVYRALGETVAGLGGFDGSTPRTLRVLMYHKVNDLPDNPVTVPPSVFDEQMAQLRELGYTAVGLEEVLAHYRLGTALPHGATLITFDDGYRDTLEYALPVLKRYGYPAVVFVPIGHIGEPRPLPHEHRLAARNIVNRTLEWDALAELEGEGVRVECHGISHRPLTALAIDEAVKEIALSKLRLEDALRRPVSAFAYVKGSEADYRPVHLSLVRQAGYELGFTSVSGANGPATDPFRLHRYNVEPYPARTFELVLRGACDLIAVKDTVPGAYARRAFNAVLRTSSA